MNVKLFTNNAVSITYGNNAVKYIILPAFLMPLIKQKNAMSQPSAKQTTNCHLG